VNDPTRAGAAETLRRIKDESFPQVTPELLEAVFQIETETQFENARQPAVARLRDLFLEGVGEGT
jgi:hypothetical protein